MMMEYFMPSDVARLVLEHSDLPYSQERSTAVRIRVQGSTSPSKQVIHKKATVLQALGWLQVALHCLATNEDVSGYLKDHRYMKSYMCFLEECSLLQEFNILFKAGRQPQITFPNFSLVLIIDEWGRYKQHCTCSNKRHQHTVMTQNNDCQSEEISDNSLVGDNDVYQRATRGSTCSSPVKRVAAIDAAVKALDFPLKTVPLAVSDTSEILEQSQKLPSGEHYVTELPHQRELCKQDSLSSISSNKRPLSNDRVRQLCGSENFSDCVNNKINDDYSVDTETLQIVEENVNNHTDINRTTDRKHMIEFLEKSSKSESDTSAESVKANVEYPFIKLVEDIGKNKEILITCSNKESLAEIKSDEQFSQNNEITIKQNNYASHRTNVDNPLVTSHPSTTLDCSNKITGLSNKILNRIDTVSSWIKNNDSQEQESKKITENITDIRQQNAANLEVHEEKPVNSCISRTLTSNESVESAVSQAKDHIVLLQLTPSKTPSCTSSTAGPDLQLTPIKTPSCTSLTAGQNLQLTSSKTPSCISSTSDPNLQMIPSKTPSCTSSTTGPSLGVPIYHLNNTDSLLMKSPRRKKPKTPKKRTINDTTHLPERNCENPLFQQILNDTRLHMKLAETCNLVTGQFKLNNCSSNKDKELHSKSGVSNHSDDMETITASKSLEDILDMDTNLTTELNMDLSDPVFEPFFKLFGTDIETDNENLRKENLKTAQMEADLEELEKSIHEELQLSQFPSSNKDEGYVTNFNSPHHQICITEPRTNQCASPHVAVGDNGHPVVQVPVQQVNEIGSLCSTAIGNSLHQNKDNLSKTTASLTAQAFSLADIPYSQNNPPSNEQLHVQPPSSMHGTYNCENMLRSQSYPSTLNQNLFHRDDHDSGTPVHDVCLTHSHPGSDPAYPIHHSSPINKLHSATLSGNFPAHLSPLVQTNFNPSNHWLIKSASHASLISKKGLLIPNNQEEANRLTNTNQSCVLVSNEQIIKQGPDLIEHDTLSHPAINEHGSTSTPVVFDIHTSLFSGQPLSSGHNYEERANCLKIIHDAIDLIQSSPEAPHNDSYFNDMQCDLQGAFSTIGNTMGCLSLPGNVDENNSEPTAKSMTRKMSGRKKKAAIEKSDSPRYQYTTLKHLLSKPTHSTVPSQLHTLMIFDPSSSKSPEKVGSAGLGEHNQTITILSPGGTTKINVPLLGFQENTDQVTHLEGGILENQYSVLSNNHNTSSPIHSLKPGNVSENGNELKEQNCKYRKTKDKPQTDSEKRPRRKRKTQPDNKEALDDKVSQYCDNVGEETYSATPIGSKSSVLNRAFVRTLDFGPEAEDPSTVHYRKIYPKIPSAENTQVIILHTNQLWNNNSQSQVGSRITIIQKIGNPDIHVERKVNEVSCESDKKTDYVVTSTDLRNDNETANISSGEIPVIGKLNEDEIKNKPSNTMNRCAKLKTSQTDVVRPQEKMIVCYDNGTNIDKIEKESECAMVKAVENAKKTPSKKISKVKEEKLQVKIVKRTSGKKIRSSSSEKQKAIDAFFKRTDIMNCKKKSPKLRAVSSDSDSSDDIPLSVLKSKITPCKSQRHLDSVMDNKSCTPETTQSAWNDNSNDVCTPTKVQLLEKVGLTPKKSLMKNTEFKSPSRVNSLDVLANIQNSNLSNKRESSTPNRCRSSQKYENQKYTSPKRSPSVKLFTSPSKDTNGIADTVVNDTERRVNSMIKLLNKNNPNILPIRNSITSDIGLKRIETKNNNNAQEDFTMNSKIKQAGNEILYEIQKEEKLPEQSENDTKNRNKTEPNLNTNESNEKLLMKSHCEIYSRNSRPHDKKIQTRVENRYEDENQTSMSDRENVIESGDIEHDHQNRNTIFEIFHENQHRYMNKEVAIQHQSRSNTVEIVDGNKSRMISVESLNENECILTLSGEIKQDRPHQSLAESNEICTIDNHMDKNKVEHSGKLMYSVEKKKWIRDKNIIGDVSVNKTDDHKSSTKEQENNTTIVHPSNTAFKCESNNNEMQMLSCKKDICLENIVCKPRCPISGSVTNQPQRTETPIKQSSVVYTSDNYCMPVHNDAHNDKHRNLVDGSSNYIPGYKMMKLSAHEKQNVIVSEKDKLSLGVKSVDSSEKLMEVRQTSANEVDGTPSLSMFSSLNPVKRKKKHKKHKHHNNGNKEQCDHHHHHHKRKRKYQDESEDLDGDSHECKRRKTEEFSKSLLENLAALNVKKALSNLYQNKPVNASEISNNKSSSTDVVPDLEQ